MLTPTALRDQYAAASTDDLRILVVGAGIAGVTVAQLLRGRGRHPVLIERSETGAHPGYMLALMPMIDPVLDELGLWDRYRASSVPFDRYAVHAHRGRTVRVDSLGDVLARYGEYRGIGRGGLMEVLTTTDCPVSYGITVSGLDEQQDCVKVTCTRSGAELEFDCVIVADGIHSATRELVSEPAAELDTQWGGWVVWAPADADTDLGEELWGAGFFLGTYPVPGKIGVFLGGHREDTAAGPEAFVARIRSQLTTSNARIDGALDAVRNATESFYWPLADSRSPGWSSGRSVLLGDAAAGFLPTAGIGAGMAMESAWVLATMLREARPDTVAPLLQAYERTQRPRVEAAQNASRTLARMMFHRSKTLAVLRDALLRVTSISVALRPIQRLLATRPDPTTALRRPTG
ncbi:NAD(P)/FAD-dependent oxidoreductase [Kribbella sp. HUAS MG21]|uniref:NAD(P)/FAD-dependent oxidoreductase n=1 Tax=Kribbella sp. HUAS MG21 TaxID=3160966 RepID=A0AAU7T563_9ACTN